MHLESLCCSVIMEYIENYASNLVEVSHFDKSFRKGWIGWILIGNVGILGIGIGGLLKIGSGNLSVMSGTHYSWIWTINAFQTNWAICFLYDSSISENRLLFNIFHMQFEKK